MIFLSVTFVRDEKQLKVYHTQMKNVIYLSAGLRYSARPQVKVDLRYNIGVWYLTVP